MQRPALYSNSSTLSQSRNFERQHALPSQEFEPRGHTNATRPSFLTPFAPAPDDEDIPPPRMPITLIQRRYTPDMSIDEYLSLPPLPKPTIIPRPKRLLTPEATPSTKERAPAEPRAKRKPEAVTAVASNSGREEVAVENAEKPKEIAGVLQAKALDLGAERVGDKAQYWSGQKEEPAAFPKETKKRSRSRAKPRPKPAVVGAEVAGFETGIVGGKARDKDAKVGGPEEENRHAAPVTTAKKLARPRAKSIPTASVHAVENSGQPGETKASRPVENSPARELASRLIMPVSFPERQASADSRTDGPLLTTLSSPGSKKRGAPPSDELQHNPPQRRRRVVSSNVIPPTPSWDGADALSFVTSPGTSIQDRDSPPTTPAVPFSALSDTPAPVSEPSYLPAGIESLDPKLHAVMTASRIFNKAGRRLDFENVSEAEQNLIIKLLICGSNLGPHFARVLQAIVRACRNPDFVERTMVLADVSLRYSGLLAEPSEFEMGWIYN